MSNLDKINPWRMPRRPQREPEADLASEGRYRRYAVFAGEGPPEGGWHDYQRGFYTEKAALGYARRLLGDRKVDWAHVVDMLALDIVVDDD